MRCTLGRIAIACLLSLTSSSPRMSFQVMHRGHNTGNSAIATLMQGRKINNYLIHSKLQWESKFHCCITGVHKGCISMTWKYPAMTKLCISQWYESTQLWQNYAYPFEAVMPNWRNYPGAAYFIANYNIIYYDIIMHNYIKYLPYAQVHTRVSSRNFGLGWKGAWQFHVPCPPPPHGINFAFWGYYNGF